MRAIINLDMDTLRSFVSGVELGSFARAALAVGRSQSALSGQMRKLEAQVGEALFSKAGRGLALTAAGEALLGYARKMLALNDEAINVIRTAQLEGVVKLGLPADFAEGWLPRVLGVFARRYPMVQIQVHASRSAELVDKVATKQLDFALAWGEPGHGANARAIGSIATAWIGAKGRPLPLDRDGIVPVVAFDEPCIFRHLGLAALDRQGLRWRLSFVSPSLPGLWAAVDAGLGITVRTAISLPAHLSFLDPLAAGLPALPSVALSLHTASAQQTPAAVLLADLIVSSLASAGLTGSGVKM